MKYTTFSVGVGGNTVNIDCASLPNYNKLTVDNFGIRSVSIKADGTSSTPRAISIVGYNQTNGILTITHEGTATRLTGTLVVGVWY